MDTEADLEVVGVVVSVVVGVVVPVVSVVPVVVVSSGATVEGCFSYSTGGTSSEEEATSTSE